MGGSLEDRLTATASTDGPSSGVVVGAVAEWEDGMKRKCSCGDTNPKHVVATRHTHDGVHVNVHHDGSLSGHMHYVVGGRARPEHLWRMAAEICITNWAHLPELVRAAKRADFGKPPRVLYQIWAANGTGALPNQFTDERGRLVDMRPRDTRMRRPDGSKFTIV